jgi:hypothetical protein
MTVTEMPSTTQSSVTPRSAQKYLVDLDPQYGESVALGYVTIAGKAYRKAFRAGLCMGGSGAMITVEVPQGHTVLRGVAGYDDNQFWQARNNF